MVEEFHLPTLGEKGCYFLVIFDPRRIFQAGVGIDTVGADLDEGCMDIGAIQPTGQEKGTAELEAFYQVPVKGQAGAAFGIFLKGVEQVPLNNLGLGRNVGSSAVAADTKGFKQAAAGQGGSQFAAVVWSFCTMELNGVEAAECSDFLHPVQRFVDKNPHRIDKGRQPGNDGLGRLWFNVAWALGEKDKPERIHPCRHRAGRIVCTGGAADFDAETPVHGLRNSRSN